MFKTRRNHSERQQRGTSMRQTRNMKQIIGIGKQKDVLKINIVPFLFRIYFNVLFVLEYVEYLNSVFSKNFSYSFKFGPSAPSCPKLIVDERIN
jgi:hypothetical protein